jgi:hypothetical protein
MDRYGIEDIVELLQHKVEQLLLNRVFKSNQQQQHHSVTLYLEVCILQHSLINIEFYTFLLLNPNDLGGQSGSWFVYANIT